MGIRRGPSIVKDGLVFHLDAAAERSYPGSGTTWYDLTEGGLSGTISNGASYTTTPERSINITSGSTERVVFTNNDTFQFDSGSDFSVFCWIYLKGTQNGTTGVLGNAEFQGGGWMLALDGNAPRIIVNDDIQQSNHSTSPTTFENGTWYNFGFTYINLTSSIYINGQLDDTSGTAMELSTNTSDLWIGDGQQSGWEATFHGYIAQCTIYNRLLTDTEIQQNYDALKTRFE